jgi:hypothetical protein
LAVLGAAVGVALAGGSTFESPREVTLPSRTASPVVSVSAARPTVDPARPRGLLVRGWVARSIGDLHVMVASATLEPIAIAAIDPTGMPRNGMVPFEVVFRLPRAAADGGRDLYVVPVDGAGFPIARAETRRVEGSIVELVVR